MARKIVVAAVTLLVAVGAAQLAAEDQGLPLDVQIIIAKAAAGMPPTDTEMKRLREYATQDEHASVNGVTLGDVIAIIDTAKKTGQKPPAAEIAKMRQWAAGMKQQKQKMIDDLKKLEKALDAAKKGGGGGGTAKPDNHSGTVRFVVHETAKDTDHDSSGNATFDFDATYPVRFDVKDTNGDLTVSWMTDLNSTATITGSYQVQADSTKPNYTGKTTGGCGISVPANGGSMTMGAVASLKAGGRPYFRGSASTTAPATLNVHEVYGDPPTPHDSTQQTVAFAPGPASLDDVAVFDSPFCPVANVPEAYKQMALDQMKKNMDPAVSAAALGATCTFDGAGFRKQWAAGSSFTTTVSYSYTITKQKDKGSTRATFNTQITLTFGQMEADLDIIPGQAAPGAAPPSGGAGAGAGASDPDADAYHKWVPRPYTEDDKVAKAFKVKTRDRAVTLSFCVLFHPKNGAQPKGKITVKITNASQNQGICLNYPKAADAQVQPGIFIPQGNADDGKPIQEDDDKLTIASDGASAQTKDEVRAVTVRIAARETGAYATLEASCDDRNLKAVWKLTGKQGAPIPEDTNGNHIADQWQKDNNVFDKKLAGTWDDEDKPSDKPHKGDGITLYEEYRGLFVYDPSGGTDSPVTHVRLDPTVKKLLVVADSQHALGPTVDWSSMVAAGCKVYGTATGLRTYVIGGRDYVKLDDELKPPIVDFNGDSKVYAVRVVRHAAPENDPNNPPGYTPPLGCPDGAPDQATRAPLGPFDCEGVFIVPDNVIGQFDHWVAYYTTAEMNNGSHPYTSKWFTVNGLKPEDISGPAKDPTVRARLYAEYIEDVIAHELGHATGAYHHSPSAFGGDAACPMRYWSKADAAYDWAFVSGLWNPAESSYLPTEAPENPPAGQTRVPVSYKPFSKPAWKFCGQDNVPGGDFPRLKPK